MTTDLENRLTAALAARAESVAPEDLSPRFAPAVRAPWWRRRAAYVGGGLLVAAAATTAVVVLTSGGEPETSPQPPIATDRTTPPPSPTPPAEPTEPTEPAEPDVPEGVLPRDDVRFSRDGQTVTFDDGSRVRVAGDRIVVTYQGRRSTGTLPTEAASGVADVQVQLGQAGVGYLVEQSGGEFIDYVLAVPQGDGTVVIATEPEDVPFGPVLDGELNQTAETWSSGGGSLLWTRVLDQSRGAPDGAYELYGWEVPGPGEGGGPDNTAVELKPTSYGVVCFDDAAGTVARCPS